MLKKSLLIGLAFAGLNAAVAAEDGQSIILDGKEVSIYENFAIQNKGSKINADNLGTNAADPVVIADLAYDLQAVKSNGNDGNNIALVVSKDKNLSAFAISSAIRYVCKRDAYNCIPDGVVAEQIGNTYLYKVKVSNFAEWQKTINLLKESNFVKKVYPEYNFGHKNIIN